MIDWNSDLRMIEADLSWLPHKTGKQSVIEGTRNSIVAIVDRHGPIKKPIEKEHQLKFSRSKMSDT